MNDHLVPCGKHCRKTRECWAAYMRAYIARNRVRINARRRARVAELSPQERERRLVLNRANGQRFRDIHRDEAAFRSRNAEKSRRWAASNMPEVLAKAYAWKAANPEKHRESKRKTRLRPEYREMERLWGAVRRHRKRAAGRPDLEWLRVLSLDPCAYCGGRATEIDHITPVSRGGTNDWDNLTASCRSCNASKATDSLVPFLLRRTA